MDFLIISTNGGNRESSSSPTNQCGSTGNYKNNVLLFSYIVQLWAQEKFKCGPGNIV